VRWAGTGRTATAIALSKEMYPNGADVVYVARDDLFPDALTGGPLAAADGGPVLLVSPKSVPAETATELRRLGPDRVVVLGGSAAVADQVATQLRTVTGATVSRHPGIDRYDTAARISRDHFAPGVETVFIATGESFPDALAGGAAAAHLEGPVLLVQERGVPSVTSSELARLHPRHVVVLGGPGAVPETVLRSNGTVAGVTAERVAGSSRYDTAALLSAAVFTGPVDTAFIATGDDFPDALAGVPAAAHFKTSLLLTPRDALPAEVRAELCRLQPTRIVILGGTTAVAPAVQVALAACLATRKA
jgi:putative cell wall-binding protein